MKAIFQAIQDHLVKSGPQTTKKLFQQLGKGEISEGGFAQRLWRASVDGYIQRVSPTPGPGIWDSTGMRAAPVEVPQIEPVGEPAAPRRYDMLRAPVLVHRDMQPARRGASDHESKAASRRGDDLIAHQRPIHMCSQLKGGMQ